MVVPAARNLGPGDSMWFSQGCTMGCACDEENSKELEGTELAADDATTPAIETEVAEEVEE